MKIPNILISVTNGNTLKVACKLYSLIDWDKQSKNGFEVCVKQSTIALSCGLSLSTVKRAIAELCARNIITHRYRITYSNGHQGTYHYSLALFTRFFNLRHDIFKYALSAQEFTLYAAMCKLRTNATSSFYQSLNDLSRITGLDKSDICKLYTVLDKKRLVCKQKKRTKLGDYTDNTYFVVVRVKGKLTKKAPRFLAQLSNATNIVSKVIFVVKRESAEYFVNKKRREEATYFYKGGSG